MTEINQDNVEQCIRDAILHYYDVGLLPDAMFWKHCLGILQKKYNFDMGNYMENDKQ